MDPTGMTPFQCSTQQEIVSMFTRNFRSTMLCAAMAIACAWLLSPPGPVHADSIVVESCAASDLIAAITTANANATNDIILLNSGCTYTLTEVNNATDGPNGLPSIASSMVILGNGAVIERSDAPDTPPFRVFHIAANGALALKQVTVRNGQDA